MNLEKQVQDLENLLEFERNKYAKQLQGLKSGLIAKFRKDMQMELDGITAIANRLPADEAESLRRWISNLNQLVNTY